MRYMLLMYRDEKWWDAKPEAERIAIRQQAIDASEPLRQRGIERRQRNRQRHEDQDLLP